MRAIPTSDVRYLDFMALGILAQSVLFVAIFHEIAIIWERDMGVVHKLLATPTPHAALVLGKALSVGIRTPPQAVIIFAEQAKHRILVHALRANEEAVALAVASWIASLLISWQPTPAAVSPSRR